MLSLCFCFFSHYIACALYTLAVCETLIPSGIGVQRRAARFVQSCYVREPGTVTKLLNSLNWQPLELRRKITCLTIMYKTVHGKITIDIPAHITSQNHVIRSCHH